MSDTENNDSLDIRRSSRRRESAKVTSRKSALEAMKEARKTGKAYRPNMDVDDVYEMVDEEEYNRIVSKRQNENFVVDDDGMGYVDTGVDFEDEYDEDDLEEASSSKKSKKSKADKKKKKGAMDAFLSMTSKKVVDESKIKVNLEEDEDLKNMLGDILDNEDNEQEVEPVKATPRNPFKRDRIDSPDTSMTPKPIAKKAKTSLLAKKVLPPKQSLSVNKETLPVKVEQAEEEDYDDDDYGIPDVNDDIEPLENIDDREENKIIKKETFDDVEPMEAAEDDESKKEPSEVLDDWDVNEEEIDQNVDVQVGSEDFYVTGGENNDQKAVRMYWIDAFEDSHKNTGTVYLFGRVQVSTNNWASCCCVVKKIQRQVFFMPKEDVADVDVFNDIRKVLKSKLGLTEFRCRPVEKRLINDTDFGDFAGERTKLMEVQYDSTFGKLPSELKGDTFLRVFNTTTTPMEYLLTEKKFMGPGWIEIYNFNAVTAKVSNCQYEFNVDMDRMKNCRYLANQSEVKPPSVRLMALNVVSALNEKKENEICMISMLFNPKSSFVHPSCATKDLQRKCLVTRPVGGALPFDIKRQIENQNLNQIVITTHNEKSLLYLFLAKISEMEPDIIVGHDLSAMVSLLVSRLDKLKVTNWSRISRLKRTIAIGKVGHNKSAQWELTAGRLLLDSRLAAMELMKSRSYDITELANKLLSYCRKEYYANDIVNMYTSSSHLLNLINWSWSDPLLSLRILVQLNALPLFTQITNIVGGVTSRTLMGGRAERNEYLLLHAFHKAELIAPDKYNPFAKKAGTVKKEDDVEDGETTGKTKAQYSGGLVLDPKKGLYETLILLLDFNSLYPSIIQEYNICFTTVAHKKDGSDLPECPEVNGEGVLPSEIRKLVECRRNVKAMMKSEKKESERKQLDIRQMALKLTANSMYGCLGFQYSRFYAKPLAALVTSKGREILMHTKDLVEKLGYSVIYGDTDSIMINTNLVDITEAKRIGFEIKKQVNKCHRLLELDLDGIFKRMLLLKKKKYAALTIDPDTKVEAQELKGLDIVRRDWSQLAKETGTAVVDRILDPSLSRDQLVSAIDDLLNKMREKLDSGKLGVEVFQISKQLTRNPMDYKDLKSQPHAEVARRLNESGKFNLRNGDIVDYVICEDGTTNAPTQRAYHRTEMEDNKDLKIDVLYYLAQQIHPVVSRLCEPIEETDGVRIAESLGMDSTNYRRSAAAQAANVAEEDDMIWHEENYDFCEGIDVECPKCKQRKVVRQTIDPTTSKLSLASCSSCEEDWTGDYASFVYNQVDRQLSSFVERHMSAAYKCDEPMCEFKTKLQTMKWCREGLECVRCSTGILRREYTSKQLFDQQMFFYILMDVDAAMGKMDPKEQKAVRMNEEFIEAKRMLMEIRDMIDKKYLKKNSYNRVDLAYLFAPMLKIN